MATAPVRIQHAPRFTAWFPDFLRKELAPYPGRGILVARTVIAATLTMIIVVTFRIPGGAIGALCAFVLSRENLVSTAKSAITFVGAFSFAGLFIPIGARFFASEPITHFLWEAVSVFTVFFLLRTMTNYAIATGLSLVTTNILSIWYLPGPVENNIELTLWQVAAALTGAMVTVAVEFAFHAISGRDELIDGLDSRLKAIEDRMDCYAKGTSGPAKTESLLAQFAIVGVGALRRNVARALDEPLHRMRMSTLVSLTGRAVDFAAALSSGFPIFPVQHRPRAERLVLSIREIRNCLQTHGRPCESDLVTEPSADTPLLSELESMVSLMPSIFSTSTAIDPRLDVLEGPPPAQRIFVEDAFANAEHIRYALSGTLAAMACYILYVSLAWPGLSTAVTTCVLTGLTNVGASRQKQVLRVVGAVLGGFVFGMGAQIFVLPYIDSIGGFTVLFATVTAIAAWIGTASSRLSYAGVQIALAFYLVHLSEFSIQTSLSLARDRSIGVLLGISMMWLVFERFFPRKASDEMIRIFVGNLRLMAELMATPQDIDAASILRVRRQREQVYRKFGEVSAQMDAVPFETGAKRAGDMAARDRIRRWQASLRSLYLAETPLLQFRVFGAGAAKTGPYAEYEDSFRSATSQALEQIAIELEKQLHGNPDWRCPVPNLVELVDASNARLGDAFSEREHALAGMSRNVASVLDRLQTEVAAESVYATD
jgi:multidrug resistance protein MdtO